MGLHAIEWKCRNMFFLIGNIYQGFFKKKLGREHAGSKIEGRFFGKVI